MDQPTPVPSFVRQTALVALAGLGIGVLTSFGQGSLPFELAPLANSAGSWSLAAFLLAMVTASPRRGAVLGAVALAAMLGGYVLATLVRGFAVSTALLLFWGLASVVVGPALGVAAAWVRGPDPYRLAAGVALMAGILVGEGAYGLTVIADTTPAVYWIGSIVVGLALLAVVGVRRLRRPEHLAAGAILTASAAAAFYVTYSGNLIALF